MAIESLVTHHLVAKIKLDNVNAIVSRLGISIPDGGLELDSLEQ